MNESSERKNVFPKLAKGAVLGMFLGLLFADISENRILGYVMGMACGIAMGIGFADIHMVKRRKFSKLSNKEKKVRVALLVLVVISLLSGLAMFFLVTK